MPEEPTCYGTMFPDLDTLEYNRACHGKVLAATVSSAGIGVSGRKISIDTEQWAACQACPHYRDCYDLSMAKLALESALRRF